MRACVSVCHLLQAEWRDFLCFSRGADLLAQRVHVSGCLHWVSDIVSAVTRMHSLVGQPVATRWTLRHVVRVSNLVVTTSKDSDAC